MRIRSKKKKIALILGFAGMLIIGGISMYLLSDRRRSYDAEESEASNMLTEIAVEADGLLSMPPKYIIKNDSGNLELGVARKFGGAVVYFKNNVLPDNTPANGNMIDYFQGGALLSHAIWLHPSDIKERNYCYESQKKVWEIPSWQETEKNCIDSNKDSNDICYCQKTEPYHNPTQGGTISDGWYGNINTRNDPDSVKIKGSKFQISTRLVNFNYAYHQSMQGDESQKHGFNEINKSEWQTDFWIDQEIYFHEEVNDVIVFDTKITYCKDDNSNCSNKPVVFADNQLMTFFSAGTGLAEIYNQPDYYGPYSKVGYFSKKNDYVILGEEKTPYPSSGYIKDFSEPWVAVLQENKYQDQYIGAGISVLNYEPVKNFNKNETNGIHVANLANEFEGSFPAVSLVQPRLDLFDSYGLLRLEIGDNLVKGLEGENYDLSLLKLTVDEETGGSVNEEIPRYRIKPRGWFRYKGFLTSGTLSDIRSNLTKIQDSYCISECNGKECGDDSCGGSCGDCNENETCKNGSCVVDEEDNNGEFDVDLNDDGKINLADYQIFVNDYKESKETGEVKYRSDFNEDGRLNLADYQIFEEEYLESK